MSKVCFIGVGNMGHPMARRVRAAGHELRVHDRERAAATGLEEMGATWADSVGDAVRGAEVICLSLPGPRQVAEVLMGPGGVVECAQSGSVIVDHTTNSVATVRDLGHRCLKAGLGFLDAPVSGGSAGAAGGTLVVMVGGSPADLEVARPVLEAFGNPVLHLGQLGAGTVAKLVNNQLFLCREVVFQEGLVLAAKAGLDPRMLLRVLRHTGVGGEHVQNSARVVARQFEGPGFALALAEKDVALALRAGRDLDVPMPASGAAHERYVEAIAAGLGQQRSFATLLMVERAAGFTVPAVDASPGDVS